MPVFDLSIFAEKQVKAARAHRIARRDVGTCAGFPLFADVIPSAHSRFRINSAAVAR
jgi:hypothetical protein